MLKNKFSELSLSKEMGRRYIPAIIAVLVFLMTVLVVTASNIGGAVFQWNSKIQNRYTLQIPTLDLLPVDFLDETKSKPIDPKTLLEKVITFLKNDQSVISFHIVDQNEIRNLMKDWSGEEDLLPMPILIDIDTSSEFKAPDFTNKLTALQSNIRIDHHKKWEESIQTFGIALKMGIIFFTLLIIACIIVLMTLITKSALQSHAKVIEVLRLMGARNAYIARLYQLPVFMSSLIGGIVGAVLSIPAIYGFTFLTQKFGLTLNLMTKQNAYLMCSVPIVIALISFYTTKVTVARTLRK